MSFIAENQKTTVRPSNVLESRRWTFWSRQDFWRIIHWPDSLVRIALGKPSNLGRYQLFTFLIYNGIAPITASEWIIRCYPELDNDGRRHLHWLARNYKTLTNSLAKKTYFDMQTGKYEPF